ncbi:MAG: hypothetical protein ACREE2_19215 [Stellaceae bacterium]
MEHAFEQTNIVRFPRTVSGVSTPKDAMTPLALNRYEFNEPELKRLCRWYSAMKFAFPGTEGVMVVSHQESYSAVGLYNKMGGAPNCLVAKHEAGGRIKFFWSTEFDSPRAISNLSEIIDAHIRAIRPPRDETGWLDPAGWTGVYAARLIATQLQVV